MAFNPSPKVAAARELGKRFIKDQVIVLMIDRRIGTLEYASWGRTPGLCDRAKQLADRAYHTILRAEGELAGEEEP